MQNNYNQSLYRTLTKTIVYAAGFIILLWLLFKISGAVLLLLFSLVMAIIINSPVSWLEKRKVKRVWASIMVFAVIIIVLVLLGWLIIPKISKQLQLLITNLPGYAEQLSVNVASWFKDYPELSKKIREEGNSLSEWIPSLPSTLVRIGNYSLSFLTIVVIFIVFASMVAYAVTNPHPLLETYFSLFNLEKRDRARDALQHTSVMLIGWFRSNLIGGGIEAVLTTVFLSLMNVPGAWVWGAITLIAELIPKVGFYIMSLPPVLVALAESPVKAAWVMVFFIVLDEIMGDFVMPKLRASTMKIHPVSTLFVLIAMTSAFGLIGALLATPMAAIIKAFYEEFYLSDLKEDKDMNERIRSVIYKNEDEKRDRPL